MKQSNYFYLTERSEVKEKYPSGRSEATHKTELQAPPRSGGYRGKECIVVYGFRLDYYLYFAS